MGAVISYSDPGGGRSEGVGKFLQGGGTGSVAVQGGDVGPHPKDGAGPGQFYRRVTRRITGKQPRRQTDENWEYPPLAEALGEAGFEDIRKSVTRRQNTVAQYIVTQPILDLCERATRRPGARVSLQWWEQDGIDLEGEKKRAAEKTTISELES